MPRRIATGERNHVLHGCCDLESGRTWIYLKILVAVHATENEESFVERFS